MEPLTRVGNRMQVYRKRHNLNGFVCPKCQALKKSGTGYLSHLEVCGLTVEEMIGAYYQCPDCPSQIRKVSVAAHLLSCPGPNGEYQKRRLERQLREAEATPTAVGTDDDALRLNNSGRLERRSAVKARSSFRDLDLVDERPEDVRKLVCRRGNC